MAKAASAARAVARRAVRALIACGLAATALGLLARLSWFAELFVHFRAQGSVGLTLGALAALALRDRPAALVALAVSLVHTAPLVARYAGHVRTAPASAPRFRVAVANVLTENRDHATLAGILRGYEPDVLGLVETDEGWLRDLGPFTARFAHRVEHPRDDHFGLALYSRFSIRESEVAYVVPSAPPVLFATLEAPGGPVSVALLHTTPPMGAAWSRLRDAMLDAVARHMVARGGRAIVMGDFNATPWSPGLATPFERAGFVDPRWGRGVLASWEAPLPGLAIPIDHTLIRGALAVDEFRVGPRFGSDHRPLLVRLASTTDAR